MSLLRSNRRDLALVACALGTALLGASSALLGVCGPFTDVAADSFCPFVLEIFSLGITTGTTPTTYDPTATVNRLQMAAFLSRSVDGVMKRGRRAALEQFWTAQNPSVLGLTTVGLNPLLLKSDGVDVWVANSFGGGTVSHVRGTDGKLLETWTGATSAFGILVAMGRVFATAATAPFGKLYRIDPTQPAGAVTTVASNLGSGSGGIVFDGSRIWIANIGDGTAGTGSVSIVTPGTSIPWAVTNVSVGFSQLLGAVFDGSNVWVTDIDVNQLLKLSPAGAILQTVTVGTNPDFPVFDGANIWVPNSVSNSISVVRASNGAVLQTLTGNGLDGPRAAAFDGQRVLVTNRSGDSVSLWKAADLTTIGTFQTGAGSGLYGACSDGVNFWIAFNSLNQVARF